jgi:hypothetical protein
MKTFSHHDRALKRTSVHHPYKWGYLDDVRLFTSTHLPFIGLTGGFTAGLTGFTTGAAGWIG